MPVTSVFRPVIGFDVDPNTMTITMPLLARTDPVVTIPAFAKTG
jgi:hypothetical protein